jgi:tRNA threonylcarbamoyladenosine biosynthesis protein TsaB
MELLEKENMDQYLLALDTSTRALTVALLQGNRLLAEDGMEAERNHSIYLLPVVQRMLAAHNVPIQQLQAVAVGQGPGSYTGVRIAVTVGKTLAWSLKIPLIGISSLSAYAHSARLTDEGLTYYVPLMDARRGQAYSALFADRFGLWERLTEDRIVPAASWLDEVSEQFATSDADRLVLLGDLDVAETAVNSLRSRFDERVHCSSGSLSAYHIGLLARLRLLNGETDDLHAFVPNYTQLAEAEAKLQSKHSRGGTEHGTLGIADK